MAGEYRLLGGFSSLLGMAINGEEIWAIFFLLSQQ